MENPATYTSYNIDANLAESVWDAVIALEIAKNPPKEVGVRIAPDDNGRYNVEFAVCSSDGEYSDDVVAVIALEPMAGKDAISNEGLDRAVKFMFLYEAVHATMQKYMANLE